ncbi:MAG: hypothetical protein K9M45_11075 [Kiritimatiellales bacterium]|nr:hypothetical protein [Kiritimatiellales bacterium]
MISSESFWVDEGTTTAYSGLSSLSKVADKIWNDTNSEAQMPLYVFGVWGWAQLVPANEWALRSFNLVWLIGIFIGAVYFGRNNRVLIFPLVLMMQPFLWRYMNEFRPYAMQIFFSMWQLVALFDFYHDRNRKWRMALFLGASLGSAALHMLGVIPTVVQGLLVLGIFIKRRQWPSRYEWIALAVGVLCFGGLGLYFLHTLLGGAGGAKVWSLGIGNLLFSFYELIGLNGMGPSHLLLRNAARTGLGPIINACRPFFVGMGLLTGLIGATTIYGFYLLKRDRSRVLELFFLLAICVLNFSGLFLLASVVNWPFWGRHLAPVLPAYTVVLSLLLSAVYSHRIMKWVGIVLIMVLIWSALSLRFSSRFAKEDYRKAVQVALDAQHEGKVVWFIASDLTAKFYGATFDNDEPKGLINPGTAQDVTNLPRPDLICISRPEVTDPHDAVRNFVEKSGYVKTKLQIHGFTVWRVP